MRGVVSLKELREEHRHLAGGKALSLAAMARSGVTVPAGLCLTTEVYHTFLTRTGLRDRIDFEINRKPVEDMRWEEMWDTSLRIRNLFTGTEYPTTILAGLRKAIENAFGHRPVVVRSSAPGEDSTKTSFAGIHASYVNVRGTQSILQNIRLVWASLWSDAAILYRTELGLDVASSSMAVVVQEFLAGTSSGVAFEEDPTNASRSVVESVYGLNAGLVDGAIEPDRWLLDRVNDEVLQHIAPRREYKLVPVETGFEKRPLSANERKTPPLSRQQLLEARRLAGRLSDLFKAPQDVEWTFQGNRLAALQSRAITTAAEKTDDPRKWHMSLRRTLENLRHLQTRIEGEHLPAMENEAEHFSKKSLARLSDEDLLGELDKRLTIYQKWRNIYWEDFIPFAHGARLFGEFYNDAVQPEDPHEFVGLLAGTPMESIRRNDMLAELASILRDAPDTLAALESGRETAATRRFLTSLGEYRRRFGTGAVSDAEPDAQDPLIPLIAELSRAEHVHTGMPAEDASELQERFLSRFAGDRREKAEELLKLGQASYRLRDDDNIYLGRIGRLVEEARDEATRRGLKFQREQTVRLDFSPTAGASRRSHRPAEHSKMRPRQLTGQPAGPGFAEGAARIVVTGAELFGFKEGEVLVCDALDPNMTFVAPLAAAIVERRGGMLIHGAIVAREYGIPCVTGVRAAMELLKTGDRLKVDGYLGLVTVASD
jgi:pyruvate,water dikinase